MAAGGRTPRMVMWSGAGKRLGEVADGLRPADGSGASGDLPMPIFLKRAAGAESLAWMYRYHVDWDEPVSQAA